MSKATVSSVAFIYVSNEIYLASLRENREDKAKCLNY